MFVALVSLLLAGSIPSQQVRSVAQAPAPARVESRAATVLRPALPVARYSILREVAPSLREATICSVHMELLIEKVSAKGEDVQSPILIIQEYWQDQLPDPDGEHPISDEVISEMKVALELKSKDEPDIYLRQLQACVIEAAQAGVLEP